MLPQILGGAAMLAAGWFTKNKSGMPQKLTGVPQNAALAGLIVTFINQFAKPDPPLTTADGVALFAGVIAFHAVAKNLSKLLKEVKRRKWFA